MGLDLTINLVRVYTLSLTGAVTSVVNNFDTNATAFGFDFDTVSDILRVIGNNGVNLRVNPGGGIIVADSPINPPSNTIIGAAYSNNFPGAGFTTLFTIDSTSDTLNTQNPPNSGTQTVVGVLGLDAGLNTGFDIQPGTSSAFAVIGNSFLNIDLAIGAAGLIGNIILPAGFTPLGLALN